MNQYVWVVELAIKSGQADNFARLRADMGKAIFENEPNTLTYQFYMGADGQTAHIYEQYADGEAFKQHLANFDPFADRFGACVGITKFTVYGTPDSEIKKILEGFGAVFMTQSDGDAGGFTRH